MAQKVRIEFVSDGWREILNSQGVQDAVDQAGQAMAERAGDGFGYSPARLSYGGGRCGGYVNARTAEAMRAEATEKALSMAVMP